MSSILRGGAFWIKHILTYRITKTVCLGNFSNFHKWLFKVTPRKDAHGTSSVVGIGLVSKTAIGNAKKSTSRYSQLSNACGGIEKGDYPLSYRNQQMSINLSVDGDHRLFIR